MNSLSDLNSISSSQVLVPHDYRPTQVEFSGILYPSITAYESYPFTATDGQFLSKVINLPQDMTFTVNVSTLPGATVTWANANVASVSGNLMTVTSNVSAGTFTIGNIATLSDWNKVKEPIITMPVDPPTNWTYTSTLNYNNGNVRTINSSVTVIQMDQLSTPGLYYYSNDTTSTILYTPQIADLGLANIGINNSNLTLTITPSETTGITSLSSSSSLGGTSSFNIVTKALTITGNDTVINDHLNHITYVPVLGADVNWLAQYSLYNPTNGFTSQVNQGIASLGIKYLTYSEPMYYDKNIPKIITGIPTVTDLGSNTHTYSMTITSLEPNKILTLSATGTGGTTSFNSATKTLTITGDKTAMNSYLGNVTVAPYIDSQSDYHMVYTLAVSDGNVASRTQSIYASAAVTDIENISVTRNFITLTGEQTIFANTTPSIPEIIAGATYTIFLSSTVGKFSHIDGPSASQNYSYTGTRDQVNAVFPLIKFYPLRATTAGNYTFTYAQNRSGTPQLSQSVALIGTTRTTPLTGMGTYTFTASQTWLPSYDQANYLSWDVLVVGGGGGGSLGGGGTGHARNTGSATLIPSAHIPWSATTPVTITVGEGGYGNFAPGIGGHGGASNITIGAYDLLSVLGWTSGGTGGSGSSNIGGIGESTAGTVGTGGAGGNGGSGWYFTSTDATERILTDYYPHDANWICYGGGGGGGGSTFRGSAGGRGASGGVGSSPPYTTTPNTGGGGGGGYNTSGSAGASGLVVIKFY